MRPKKVLACAELNVAAVVSLLSAKLKMDAVELSLQLEDNISATLNCTLCITFASIPRNVTVLCK